VRVQRVHRVVAAVLSATPVAYAEHDLDALDESEFRKQMALELDDVADLLDSQLDCREELIEAFMNALGDKGDDAEESSLDLEDLEAELDEVDAAMSVLSVVTTAVEEDSHGQPCGEDNAAPQASTAKAWVTSIGNSITNAFWKFIGEEK
jgi:hypothetical protein